MFHKLLCCLSLSFVTLVNASSIIRKSIQYIPKIENVAAVDTTTKQIFTTQNSKIASEYKEYLTTGKGKALLFNLITDDSLKHGYKPLGLTAESVQQIKYFLEKYLFVNTAEIFGVSSLPSWLAEQYENITDEIFSGIDYKKYDLGLADDICQGVGEALASRFLKNKYSFRPYFYWRKNVQNTEESAASAASAVPADSYKKFFIKKQQEEIKEALLKAKDKGHYELMSNLDQDEIKDDIANFDQSIKYLIVLETELSQSRNIEFLKEILKSYPDLVIVIAFQDHVISIQNDFLSRQDIFKHLIIAGKNLTQVGDYFLFGCYRLRTLDLPQGITQVGNYFLLECSSLQTIDLPQGIIKIGDSFLSRCYSLQTINLPSSLTQVGNNFLSRCYSLQAIDLPQGIIKIGDDFLLECSSLQTIDLPQGIIKIGDSFLCWCSSLQTINLPSSLTQVGDAFLYGCKELKIVRLSETLYQKILSKLPSGIKYEFYLQTSDQTSASAAAAASASASASAAASSAAAK